MDKLNNEETLRKFQETVANLLEEKRKVIKKKFEKSSNKDHNNGICRKSNSFCTKKKTKQWFNDSCKKIIRECNEARIKAIHTYTNPREHKRLRK